MDVVGVIRAPKVRVRLLGQRLTTREAEVTQLVSEGHSNRTIADRLGISEQTVKNHLTAVYDKTGTASRVQLALWKVRNKATS